MARNNFTWFAKLTDVCTALPPEFQAELMLAIINYGTYGIEPTFSNPLLLPTFVSVRDDIDNSINARTKNKGGRPSKGITKANHEQSALVINPENGGFETENGGFETENGGFETENPSYINHTIPYQTNTNQANTERGGKKSGKRFSAPSADEVQSYGDKWAANQGKHIDFNAQRFCDFYASKGWCVGKDPMNDWQAAVRNWIERDCENAKDPPITPRETSRKCPNCGANVYKSLGTGKWVCDSCFEELV